MMYYDDLDYAQKRLNGTILFTNDKKLVLVEKVSCNELGEMKALCTEIKNGNGLGWVPLKDLDLTPVSLGYFDYGEAKAYFAVRRPMRQDWRQGLSNKGWLVMNADRPIANNMCVQPACDLYDKTEVVINKINAFKGNIRRSMSRDFALSKEDSKIKLYYRIYEVGEFKKDKFLLNPGKEFLKEHLEESVRK